MIWARIAARNLGIRRCGAPLLAHGHNYTTSDDGYESPNSMVPGWAWNFCGPADSGSHPRMACRANGQICCWLKRGTLAHTLLVRGRRLGPQVEFGAVRLDLAPHGDKAERHHGQHDQLLHGVLPLPVPHGESRGLEPSEVAALAPDAGIRAGSRASLASRPLTGCGPRARSPRPARATRRPRPTRRRRGTGRSPGEPPVVGDREHRARIALEALLQRLGAGQVEVVGRLVEQQQRRAGQLEQQDLQPRLLAAREAGEALPRARLQLVARQRRIASSISRACSVIRISSGRPARPGRAGRASARRCPARPARRAGRPRCARRCSPASSRRKCDLPEPFEPSTATRSPYQTSRSNGFISPVSSRCSQMTARLPVRPPRSRMRTFCSRGASSGGPASSNLRSLVSAAW